MTQMVPETATAYPSGLVEWPTEEPTRNYWFCCYPSRDAEHRLQLLASNQGGSYGPESLLLVHPDDLQTHQRVMRALSDRGLVINALAGKPRPGTWRRYLLELEAAHAAIELLGWTLTPDEQAAIDALDAYAATCPASVRERIDRAAS